MKIVKVKGDDSKFGLGPLTFADLKTIRDACKAFGQQGSARAKQISEEIEKQMAQISV